MSLLIASFPETRLVAKKVAGMLNAEYSDIRQASFPDNESKIKLTENPKNKTTIIISSFSKEPNKKIIETVLASNIAKDYGSNKVIILALYLPYMRQDAHFELYDSLSAKSVIKMLSNNCDELITIDPHLHRIESLRKISKNAREISTNNLLAGYIKSRYARFTIVGPDNESQQWGKRIAEQLNKEAIILKKTRTSSEKVKIHYKKLPSNILIIDDIISTGQTLLETIKMAEAQGAENIVCIGIHGLLLNGIDKQITKHAKLITTNTIQNKYAEIDVSPLIAEELGKRRSHAITCSQG